MTNANRNSLILGLGILSIVTIALRLPGLTWGLPGTYYLNEPMFHPDELSTIVRGIIHFKNPDALTFTWGGALYYRLSWVANQLTGVTEITTGFMYRQPLIILRILNLAFSLSLVLAVGACTYLITRSYFSSLISSLAIAIFPGQILDSGFARGDTLLILFCSIFLLLSICYLHLKKFEYLLGAALFAGLSISTMSWGIICIPSLGAVIVEAWQRRYFHFSSLMMRNIIIICVAGVVAGYLIGSIESFIFFPNL